VTGGEDTEAEGVGRLRAAVGRARDRVDAALDPHQPGSRAAAEDLARSKVERRVGAPDRADEAAVVVPAGADRPSAVVVAGGETALVGGFAGAPSWLGERSLAVDGFVAAGDGRDDAATVRALAAAGHEPTVYGPDGSSAVAAAADAGLRTAPFGGADVAVLGSDTVLLGGPDGDRTTLVANPGGTAAVVPEGADPSWVPDATGDRPAVTVTASAAPGVETDRVVAFGAFDAEAADRLADRGVRGVAAGGRADRMVALGVDETGTPRVTTAGIVTPAAFGAREREAAVERGEAPPGRTLDELETRVETTDPTPDRTPDRGP
jgi:hypothetical protein